MSSQNSLRSSGSALASLTATYTDSEDEDDLDLVNKGVILQNDGLEDPMSLPSSPRLPDSCSSGDGSQRTSRPPKRSGLVSYHDEDLIDDDAIDDYISESPNDMETQEDLPSPSTVQTDGLDERKSRIPPEPTAKCRAELQEKITKVYERKLKGGFDMNEYIQNKKSFRNPSIYEKLIKYCNLDELGTNYPRDMYDPHEWPESSFYDELGKAQKADMERREKERKERTKIDYVSGTIKKAGNGALPPPVVLPSIALSEEQRRKTKWDQKGAFNAALILPPTVASSASGTKSTVISAFGSLPKKK